MSGTPARWASRCNDRLNPRALSCAPWRPCATLFAEMAKLPGDATLYVHKPWSAAAQAITTQGDQVPDTFDYPLEVSLAREVVQVWSASRDGRKPSPKEAAGAVIHYATYDAYRPVEVSDTCRIHAR